MNLLKDLWLDVKCQKLIFHSTQFQSWILFCLLFVTDYRKLEIQLSTQFCQFCFFSRKKRQNSSKNILQILYSPFRIAGSFPQSSSGLQEWHGWIPTSARKAVDFLPEGTIELFSTWWFAFLFQHTAGSYRCYPS